MMPAAQADTELLEKRTYELQSHMLRTVLVVLFLIYPSLSVRMLNVLNCKDIHGTEYLDADISVECYTPLHNTFIFVATVGILLYAVGIPLGFLWLMRHYQVPGIARYKRDCHLLKQTLIKMNSQLESPELYRYAHRPALHVCLLPLHRIRSPSCWSYCG